MAAAGGGCVDVKEIDSIDSKEIDTKDKCEDDMREEKKKRFQFKKWNAVAYWSYNIAQDKCAICRCSIYEPSIHNQSIGSSEINIGWGTCNHCFHIECIGKWLNSNTNCPLCGRDWEYQATRST